MTTTAGEAVAHRADWPRRSASELDPKQIISVDTLPPIGADARLDLDYAVCVLLQQAA